MSDERKFNNDVITGRGIQRRIQVSWVTIPNGILLKLTLIPFNQSVREKGLNNSLLITSNNSTSFNLFNFFRGIFFSSLDLFLCTFSLSLSLCIVSQRILAQTKHMHVFRINLHLRILHTITKFFKEMLNR